MITKKTFYQKHLDQVSRSFSFCIKELSSPYQEWVGLSYLVCRLLDTIEDSLWTSSQQQKNSFDQFHQFLQSPPNEAAIIKWAQQFPETLPPSEQNLLKDAHIILLDLHRLPSDAQRAILPSVRHMSAGMQYFTQNFSRNDHLYITSPEQTDQYCFFVAGVVGELLTKLFHLGAQQHFPLSQTNLKNAIHFGLFLQKINLLKDQRGDEQEGRHLISSRQNVLDSLALHAEKSFEYVLSLPPIEGGFRLFCAWSLFLGLASLPWIEKSWKAQKNFKIPRTQTWLTLNKVKKNITSPDALIEMFSQMKPSATQTTGRPHSSSQQPLFSWFSEIYQDGELSPASLNELSLFSV